MLYVYDGNQEEPEQYVVLNGQEEGRDVSEFDAWVGPLLPPDTTEPAPEVPEWSTCVLCGKQTERTEVARLDCQKYAVDLVRAPVAPPTCDIDPEEVGRALDVLVSGGETNFTALIAAAREYLRLREQPAPDVQAQIDAAVAREREEVQAHAPLYLEWVKEGALSADDALERLVIWLRARSAKGA